MDEKGDSESVVLHGWSTDMEGVEEMRSPDSRMEIQERPVNYMSKSILVENLPLESYYQRSLKVPSNFYMKAFNQKFLRKAPVQAVKAKIGIDEMEQFKIVIANAFILVMFGNVPVNDLELIVMSFFAAGVGSLFKRFLLRRIDFHNNLDREFGPILQKFGELIYLKYLMYSSANNQVYDIVQLQMSFREKEFERQHFVNASRCLPGDKFSDNMKTMIRTVTFENFYINISNPEAMNQFMDLFVLETQAEIAESKKQYFFEKDATVVQWVCGALKAARGNKFTPTLQQLFNITGVVWWENKNFSF
jgi:hypothetical protein